jgi:HEAT repeat protein
MKKALPLAFLGLAVALPAEVVPVRGEGEKPDQVKSLIDKLKDKAAAARLAAIGALANLGPKAEAAVPALVETLAAGNEDVKLNTALALGRIAKPAAGPLAEALADKAGSILVFRPAGGQQRLQRGAAGSILTVPYFPLGVASFVNG